jgi:hypothetical protein
MIQQPISTPPKEFVPQRPEAPPPAASSIDFTQLLDGGLLSLNQNGSGSASQNSSPTEWWKQKSDKTDSNTSNLAAASGVTAAQQNAAQSTSPQAPAQGTAPSAVNAQGATPNALLPSGTATATAGNGSSSQGTQAPPGAAALEARIAAGAPTYLSQPSAVLAGLWHHAGDAQPASAPAGGQANADGASGQDGTDASPNSADTSQKTVSLPQLVNEAAQAAAATAGGPHTSTDTSGQGVAVANQATPNTPAFALPGADAQQTASLPAQTSATAPTSAPMPMPIQVIPAAEQVALSLRQAAQSNTGRIEIQLKPASLGAIDVKLDVTHDGRITAVISADRSDTLQMLRQDSSGLQQALRNAGLQADSGSLSFNLRGGDQQSYSQNFSSGTPATAYGNAAPASSSTLQAARSYLRRHAGTLDIEV